MSQPRFPDPASSRAVLIGVSHFAAAGPDLPDIPAVEANLIALRQVLSSSETGVLCPDRCRVLADPTSPDEVGTALSEAAATATDLLLVYYAGHGLVDDRGRLHLALAHTHPHRARWSALPLDLLREEIANSAAATRVLVLDCCFSGRAIEAMTDDQGVVGGQLEVAGTYTLTATPANTPAHAPTGDRFTAFTGALLRALDKADPLTLDQIYVVVDRDLAARNLPRPQCRVVNTAGDLALSRGPATKSHTESPDSDAVRFRGAHSVRHVLSWVLRVVLGGLWFVLPSMLVLGFFALFLPVRYLAESLVKLTSKFDLDLVNADGATIVLLVIGGVLCLFLIVIFIRIVRGLRKFLLWLGSLFLEVGSLFRRLVAFSFRRFIRFVSSSKKVHVRELAVDRSGLTIRGMLVRTHLPWRDIVQIGVLQPEREALNHRLPATQYTRTDILVVRLRPEVPVPNVVSVLSDEHRQLGYLGLCTLESVGSSSPEMISSLERFAGGKLVHSPRQFLDRDPRLRPEMV